jgi:hypothetical protein
LAQPLKSQSTMATPSGDVTKLGAMSRIQVRSVA